MAEIKDPSRVDVDEALLAAMQTELSRLADAVHGRPGEPGAVGKLTSLMHAVFGIEGAEEPTGILTDIRKLHDKTDRIYGAIVALAGSIALAAISVSLAIASF
jgi:hypothetical protein